MDMKMILAIVIPLVVKALIDHFVKKSPKTEANTSGELIGTIIKAITGR